MLGIRLRLLGRPSSALRQTSTPVGLQCQRLIAHGASDPELVPFHVKGRGDLLVSHELRNHNVRHDTSPIDCIFFMHGSPGISRDFRFLCSSLWHFWSEKSKNRWDMIRFNMPGQGGSPVSTCVECTPPDLASVSLDFMTQWLQQEPAKPASLTLVGHSMAGHVVMNCLEQNLIDYCSEHNIRLNIVLLAPAPFRAPHSLHPFRKAIRRALALAEMLPKFLQLPLWRFYGARMHDAGFPRYLTTDVQAVKRALQRLDGLSFSDVRTRMNGVREKLLSSSVPVSLHYAYAEDDHLTKPALFEEAIDVLRTLPFSDVTSQVFPTGGHNIQKTHASEIAQSIFQMLHGQNCHTKSN